MGALPPDVAAELRNWLQLARLAAFAGFILLGIRVMRIDGARRRRAIVQLIAYVLAVNVAIALVPTDAWPFSPYPMMSTDATNDARVLQGLSFRAVDARGAEWPVDPHAWSPLFPQAIMGWFEVVYPRATNDERRAALRFLLARAERARRGTMRPLGPLTAPDTNLYAPAPQSPEPYVALRVYRTRWNPTALLADRTRFTKELLCDSRM